jgi:membrane associated rhomboid family serine protease
MIPLRDNVPTRRTPVITIGLIVANIVVFLVDQTHQVQVLYALRDGEQLQQVMGALSLRYAMIPAYVTGHAVSGALTPLYVQPAWITVFTAMFLHANWLHVGGNMLYLWIFGNNIEDVLGRLRFLIFYFACGVGAAALQLMNDPNAIVPMIGASGAIAGVMGAYLLLYPGARILSIVPLFGVVATLLNVPAVRVIGFWFVIQVLNANLLGSGEVLQHGGGVAYLAHVGGFVTGMLLIVLLGGRTAAREEPYRE